jgi:hypothetical protein
MHRIIVFLKHGKVFIENESFIETINMKFKELTLIFPTLIKTYRRLFSCLMFYN